MPFDYIPFYPVYINSLMIDQVDHLDWDQLKVSRLKEAPLIVSTGDQEVLRISKQIAPL